LNTSLASSVGKLPAGVLDFECHGKREEKHQMGIKEKLEQQLDAKLEKWKSEIDEVEAEARAQEARAEAEKADAEVQKELWSKVDSLKKRVDQGEKRLAELKDAGEDRLRSLKEEIDRLVA
jgi:chromosome segregation ATPase